MIFKQQQTSFDQSIQKPVGSAACPSAQNTGELLFEQTWYREFFSELWGIVQGGTQIGEGLGQVYLYQDRLPPADGGPQGALL